MNTEHFSNEYGYSPTDWLYRCAFERMFDDVSMCEGTLDFELEELMG